MKEDQERKRERSRNDDHESQREFKKGSKTSSSVKDHNNADKSDDDNFDEYLEGMFL
ncbi:unnamed protein product [Cuscuta europaea]|uniref:Uncharacterized protein n=1 Tax=Cuscuta europaea TaxID=41803 RepID=A0A9P1EAA0_CUSEU|nr:unnamed protein product [Cuscuta europaea]